jgi:hypothetical protein
MKLDLDKLVSTEVSLEMAHNLLFFILVYVTMCQL